MENKINIAELLKDCPKGMELDCTVFENLTFEEIDEVNSRILCNIQGNNGKLGISFNKFGCYSELNQAKCVIFPKGKTTWEGFVPPCKFKNGDVVVDDSGAIFFYRQIHPYYEEPYADFYCGVTSELRGFVIKTGEAQRCGEISSIRYATEEEKQKLFQAIEENGYKWNAETKTLEKLPKFKVGDRVKHVSAYASGIVVEVTDKGYHIDYPKAGGFCYISFELEKDYELIPNKFDINTLKPFDKVLVKTDNEHVWSIQFFERVNKVSKKTFVCMGGYRYRQCVPYKGNEHLLNTSNEPDDFYKTWE